MPFATDLDETRLFALFAGSMVILLRPFAQALARAMSFARRRAGPLDRMESLRAFLGVSHGYFQIASTVTAVLPVSRTAAIP